MIELKISMTKIFTGNIRRVIFSNLKYVSRMGLGMATFLGDNIDDWSISHKEHAFLVEIREGLYVDLDNIKSLDDKRKLKKLLEISDDKSIKIDGTFVMNNTWDINLEDTLSVNYDTVESVFPTASDDDMIRLRDMKKIVNNRKDKRNISK